MNFFLSKSIYSRRGADRNAPFTRKWGMGVPALLRVRGHLCAQMEAGGPSLSRTPIRVLPLRTNRGDASGFVHAPRFVCPKRRRAGGGAPPSPVRHPIWPARKPGVGLRAASHPRAPIEGEARKGGRLSHSCPPPRSGVVLVREGGGGRRFQICVGPWFAYPKRRWGGLPIPAPPPVRANRGVAAPGIARK